MIPEEKNAAVTRALQEPFGAANVADIRKMTKGLSSDLVFRSPQLFPLLSRLCGSGQNADAPGHGVRR